MKNLVLGFLLAAAAVPAFATQTPSEPVLAQATMHIGFRPPDYPREVTLAALASGRVVEMKTYDDGRVETTEVATLGTTLLAKLKADVEAVQPGNLTEEDPNSPPCMDAPTTIYSATSSNGTQTEVKKEMACKEYIDRSYPASHQAVIGMLNALVSLAAQLP